MADLVDPDTRDRIYLDLKGATERLSRAQVHAVDPFGDLQAALDAVQRVRHLNEVRPSTQPPIIEGLGDWSCRCRYRTGLTPRFTRRVSLDCPQHAPRSAGG